MLALRTSGCTMGLREDTHGHCRHSFRTRQQLLHKCEDLMYGGGVIQRACRGPFVNLILVRVRLRCIAVPGCCVPGCVPGCVHPWCGTVAPGVLRLRAAGAALASYSW